VEVKQEPSGVVTLVLARGSVDCEVTPRPGRSPFFVLAGDVTVEVVGTRFTVTRGPASVRVDVTRGKVRVASPEGERFVIAGGTWTNAIAATAAPVPTAPPIEDAPRATDPVQAPAAEPPKHTADLFNEAQRSDIHGDRDGAARGYRRAASGDDRWAALALYSLAELDEKRGRTTNALAEVDEYQRRFPKAANAEDAAWLRVDILRTAGRDARAAASDYVKRFPHGTYAVTAQRLADAPAP
ncbi:MAG: hypothetical protein JWO36_4133, partial [Myxococcales bacterium]|nr:hypothetical protein [Myxococcales bacterium]